ncbi:SUKH-4 family immunity protein [Amycolatopsis cynarae]|uniref:SUKH-4 family immunity protein n=1 Tax=Amycolatopsis cynarae TaxID=2995223 RepID=A0ABY7BB17_9PSEU|nr:SUKH-4 family immunity protein [Amycolatopsis sp. HUAS 11-8]WAL68422.1 SUKH-4 family immunity protein [Amycolatopsis sp. HUAS 11-8]
MAELYGGENIITVPPSDIERFSLRGEDAAVLEKVGLPRSGSPFFTTQVEGGPEFLRIIDVVTRDDKKHREVIIGGPPGDPGMRFSVSAYEGFVTLVQLQGTRPRGEVVNNNLTEFVEFLYQIRRHEILSAGDPAAARESLQDLSSHLKRIDPFSFERPDNWWAMVLDHLASTAGSQPA